MSGFPHSFNREDILPLATGAAITSSYNASTTSDPQYGTFQSQVSVFVTISTTGASAITAVTVKVEASYDGTNWVDLQFRREDTAVEAIEHIIALGAAPQNYSLLLISKEAKGAVGGLRVKAKADATGTTGDDITINMVFA